MEIGASLLVWYSRKEQNRAHFFGRVFGQRFTEIFLTSLLEWARTSLGLE